MAVGRHPPDKGSAPTPTTREFNRHNREFNPHDHEFNPHAVVTARSSDTTVVTVELGGRAG
jgi:hypothetical protein